jgi:hypothetical protein
VQAEAAVCLQWITSLFAAFNIAEGIPSSALHRHRHQEFLKFLRKIDKNVPAQLDIQMVCPQVRCRPQ